MELLAPVGEQGVRICQLQVLLQDCADGAKPKILLSLSRLRTSSILLKLRFAKFWWVTAKFEQASIRMLLTVSLVGKGQLHPNTLVFLSISLIP